MSLFLATLLLLSPGARAAGLHAGIPVQQSGLGPVEHLSAEQGWTTPLLDAQGQPVGVLRGYVGPTEAAASAWLEDMKRPVQAPLSPLAGMGDEAVIAAGVVLVREGNVALSIVLSQGDPQRRARTLLASIVDQPRAWPQAPHMRQRGTLWFFEAPGLELQVEGGHRPLGEPWGYRQLPREVLAWDAWGRAAVLRP